MIFKKFLALCLILSFIAFAGCSAYSIKKGQSEGDEAVVKNKLNRYQFYFGDMNKNTLEYNKNIIERSIRSDGSIPDEKRQSMVTEITEKLIWEKNRYFHFTINHSDAWGFGKDDFIFSIVDAKNKQIKAIAIPISYHISGSGGSFDVHRWIIKTDIPLIQANVESPLKCRIKLFKNYVLTYDMTPKD